MSMALSTDSDHCGEEKIGNTSGRDVRLYGCLIVWGFNLQAFVVESTCTADIFAACMSENACMNLKDPFFEITGKRVSAE